MKAVCRLTFCTALEVEVEIRFISMAMPMDT